MTNQNDNLFKMVKGECIFKEGDLGDEMFFIHAGKVQIEKNQPGGKLVLATLEKGDFFGEMALIEQEPRSADAVALDDVTLLKVDSEAFPKILQANPEIAIRMIRKYVIRLKQTNEKLSLASQNEQQLKTEIAKKIEAELFPIELEDRKSRQKFVCNKPELLIGRLDAVTGQAPDIDLTTVDPEKSTSRRHAKLRYIDRAWNLSEEMGVANGTYVNGKRLFAKQVVPIREGDVLRFGNLEFLVKALLPS